MKNFMRFLCAAMLLVSFAACDEKENENDNHGSGDKMRGHIGSLLHERYGERFTCTKENNVFEVKHDGRHKPLPSPFRFAIGDDGRWHTSGADDAAGAMNSQDALAATFANGALTFADAAKGYAKLAGITERAAKGVIRELFQKGTLNLQEGLYSLRK